LAKRRQPIEQNRGTPFFNRLGLTLNVLLHRSHLMLFCALSAILSLQNPARDEDGDRRLDRRPRDSTSADL
jgi:hypothetical protein